MVLVDLDRRVPIGFAASRQQVDIRKVLEEWGESVLNQMSEVSIDRSGNERGLVNQRLPNPEVVAERFQVMKIVNQDLEIARKALHNPNEENPAPDKKSRIEAALKQSKYV